MMAAKRRAPRKRYTVSWTDDWETWYTYETDDEPGPHTRNHAGVEIYLNEPIPASAFADMVNLTRAEEDWRDDIIRLP